MSRLTQAPEIRTFPNGDRFAFLSPAKEQAWCDKATSERGAHTTWHIVRFAKIGVVKAIERELKVGTLIFITGTVRYSEWTDED